LIRTDALSVGRLTMPNQRTQRGKLVLSMTFRPLRCATTNLLPISTMAPGVRSIPTKTASIPKVSWTSWRSRRAKILINSAANICIRDPVIWLYWMMWQRAAAGARHPAPGGVAASPWWNRSTLSSRTWSRHLSAMTGARARIKCGQAWIAVGWSIRTAPPRRLRAALSWLCRPASMKPSRSTKAPWCNQTFTTIDS